MLALKTQIMNADALLLVTPEYNNGVLGGFMNGIDWLSRAQGALTDEASRKSLDVYLRGFHEFVLRSERTRP